MDEVNAFEYVFPIVGCKTGKDGRSVAIGEVYGTAFYLGNNNYITAGHCIKNALQHEIIGLGLNNNGLWDFSKIWGNEIIPDYDIGIMKAAIPHTQSFSWNYDDLPMLRNVQTVGFPHALELHNRIMRMRAFKGYIVSPRTFFELPSRPACYELSFYCPRGLSGSPLFTEEDNPRVSGIIIGNTSIEIPVCNIKEKEVMEEDGKIKENIYERTESMLLGLALQTKSLQRIESKLLGGTIGDYLRSINLTQQM